MTQELIERLEKATGPDREIDCLIAVALNPAFRIEYAPGVDTLVPYVVSPPRRGEVGVPRYTASIDAALSLVPADPVYSDWTVERDDDSYQASVHAPHGDLAFSQGATPAIAMCIAALKAHALVSDDSKAG